MLRTFWAYVGIQKPYVLKASSATLKASLPPYSDLVLRKWRLGHVSVYGISGSVSGAQVKGPGSRGSGFCGVQSEIMGPGIWAVGFWSSGLSVSTAKVVYCVSAQ